MNVVRFLREHETGGGDYVSERDAILLAWDAATLVRRARGQEWRLTCRTSRPAGRHIIKDVPSVLKLDPGASSEDDELEFELHYQRGLTTAQRFEMMFSRSREICERLIRLGHRRPAEVVKRS